MSVHHPTDLRRYLHYRKKNDFVVVKYGTSWCGPCKKLTPILDNLASQHKHVYFVDADIDNPELENHPDLDNVKTIPHIKFFIDGKMEREVIGLNLEKINRYVERYSEIKLIELNNKKESDHEHSDHEHSDHESDHEKLDHEQPDKSDHEHSDHKSDHEKIGDEQLESGYLCPYCQLIENNVDQNVSDQ